jgi:hypothetical protein
VLQNSEYGLTGQSPDAACDETSKLRALSEFWRFNSGAVEDSSCGCWRWKYDVLSKRRKPFMQLCRVTSQKTGTLYIHQAITERKKGIWNFHLTSKIGFVFKIPLEGLHFYWCSRPIRQSINRSGSQSIRIALRTTATKETSIFPVSECFHIWWYVLEEGAARCKACSVEVMLNDVW